MMTKITRARLIDALVYACDWSIVGEYDTQCEIRLKMRDKACSREKCSRVHDVLDALEKLDTGEIRVPSGSSEIPNNQ